MSWFVWHSWVLVGYLRLWTTQGLMSRYLFWERLRFSTAKRTMCTTDFQGVIMDSIRCCGTTSGAPFVCMTLRLVESVEISACPLSSCSFFISLLSHTHKCPLSLCTTHYHPQEKINASWQLDQTTGQAKNCKSKEQWKTEESVCTLNFCRFYFVKALI